MLKPKVFETRKEFLITLAFLIFIIVARLGYEYQNYREFISKPFYFTYVEVLNSYKKTKNGKEYTVLKLYSDDKQTFYTTSYRKDNFSNKRLRLQIFPTSSITFIDFLGTFYVNSRIKKVEELPITTKNNLLLKIDSQHKSKELQSFYNAIFFATPIEKELREKIALLGVSHLVALSGFHLGILWGLIYTLLLLIYKPLQAKYFAYRQALFDVGIVTMLILGIYLWFVGSPPSLLRSYAMALAGWVAILMGVELLSFMFLTIIVFTLLALFPYLLVSLGFWLSVSGVFYIFLILKYVKSYSKTVITVLFIPIGIFLLMLPVVHSIFEVTSFYQLLSPIISLIFVVFYPLSMLLHIIGVGGLLDDALLWLFSLPIESKNELLPMWMASIYILLSVLAIARRKLFFIVLALAFAYGVYLFI